MAQPAIQTSFASGEWAPKLRSRVDISKYHHGAALLRNFMVDYSGGGASTRPGTRFANQCKAPGARLIPFQPSVNISYVLEFGQNYIRFFSNGAPILEGPITLQGSLNLSPAQFNNAAGYVVGDWITFNAVQGMVPPGATTSPLNGNYFIVASIVGPNFTVTDLFGNPINATGWTAYIANSGATQRVYTIQSPFTTADLFPNQATGNPGIKFVQDVTSMIICHPSYIPQILTIHAANSWALSAITFGPTIAAPQPILALDIPGTQWWYSYVVTAVDNNGQESAPSVPATGGNVGNIAAGGNLQLGFGTVPGAVSYNIYKASPSFTQAVAAGAQYGFVGNVTGNNYLESSPGVAPNFAISIPVLSSPIIGGNVTSLTLTNSGSQFTFVPTVVIGAPPAGGFQASAACTLKNVGFQPNGVQQVDGDVNKGYAGQSPVGQTITYPNGVTALISAAGYSGVGTTWNIVGLTLTNAGSITGTGTAVPGNPVGAINVSGSFDIHSSSVTMTWGVGSLTLIQGGFGYTSAPSVSFNPSGGASGTATISPLNQSGSATGGTGAAPVGNPRVPAFFQERLTLASPNAALQTFYMSQPGAFFNFNTTNPAQNDNAITASIISEELNDIRSLIPVPTGLLALTGKGAWLINGGGGISTANPITPANVSATPQAFNGANDLRPLKVNFDALFVTNKASYVRDASYNIYANIFTGADISIASNHLFFGFSLVDWCWAEEPFKTAWAVRSDGTLLSLAYVKEPEINIIGWAHHDTNGFFTSTCSVIETNAGNTVDAVYFVVQRVINGVPVSYIERMADRYFPYGYEDSWSVDCALQTKPAVTVLPGTMIGNLSLSGGVVGQSITATDTVASPFTPAMATNNWIIRAGGGIYQITAFTSSSVVTATVLRTPSLANPYTSIPFTVTTGYTIWQPVTTVGGLTQLVGQNVVGVADGSVVGVTSPLTVSTSGTVTLPNAATKVTLGLPFTPQLQTLPLDLGEPTVQGKRKKISGLTVRVADTLGLQAGTTFANAVSIKDFQLGAIPTTSNGPVKVTDLVNPSNSPNTVDGRLIIDQVWQEAGSYCIQQNLPYPATILAVMPEITVGDTGK